MKFTSEQLDILKTNIEGVIKNFDYKDETEAAKDYIADGLSLRRFLFDLFYRTEICIGDNKGWPPKAGKYDDRVIVIESHTSDHLFTALKKCVSKDTLELFDFKKKRL